MPQERKITALQKAQKVAQCALPVLLPLCVWLALKGQFPNYRTTAADVFALTSGLIVLAVFIIQLHLKSTPKQSRSRGIQSEIDELRTKLKRLEERVGTLKKVAAPAIFSEVRAMPEPRPEPARIPQSRYEPIIHDSQLSQPEPAPVISEEEISYILKEKFRELAALSESNADRLAASLRAALSDSEKNPQIAIIYRDAAVEESQVYRLQREDVQNASPSILMTFPTGVALLYPAPMAGEDCFIDVKAFSSNTPAPSQKRSYLTHCEPAELTPGNGSAYQLKKSGTLVFHS